MYPFLSIPDTLSNPVMLFAWYEMHTDGVRLRPFSHFCIRCGEGAIIVLFFAVGRDEC